MVVEADSQAREIGIFRIPPDGINHVLAAIGALADLNA